MLYIPHATPPGNDTAAAAAAAAAAATHISEDVISIPEVEVVCACTPWAPWASTCLEPLLTIRVIHLALLWI
jgi:hypothetical protein